MAPTNNKTVHQTSFTPYREQPRSTRIVVAYPRPAFSATNRTNTFQPVLINKKSKFLKATHRTKIRKIDIFNIYQNHTVIDLQMNSMRGTTIRWSTLLAEYRSTGYGCQSISWSAEQGKRFFPCPPFVPEKLVSRDGFSCSLSSPRLYLLMLMVLTHGIPPDFRGGVHYLSNRHM